jgi:phosphatidylglycerophosphatase GEP4
LTGPYENEIHPDARFGLDQALLVFGKEGVAILSNSAGTKDDPGYVDAIAIEAALGINVIRHDEKKPGGLQEVMRHFEIPEGDEASSRICMVGDRLLTDIVFGNLYGMLTVHTLPLCKGDDNKKDNFPSNMVRTAENTLLYSNANRFERYKKTKLTHKFWPGEGEAPLTVVLSDEGVAETKE